MGDHDIDAKILDVARRTKAALGESAKVEVVRSDTTYRVWEEFKLRHPDLPVPSNGVPERREFSMIPTEEAIQHYAAMQERTKQLASAKVPEAKPVEKDAKDPAAEAKTSEKTDAPKQSETPEVQTEERQVNKYKGENKPADKANWADLNGKQFEVIDEPDADGNLPTRPIHGKITVEGEAKNGENPAKFTITDADNGGVYTFELDTSVTDKVVYKCTSGPGGKYSKGNGYDLRTINGVPMLVQMNDSEGHGVSIASANVSSAATVEEEDEVPDETDDVDDPPETVSGDGKLSAEEREAKITEDAAAIMKSDFKPTTEAEKAALKNYTEEKSLFVGANLNLAAAAYAEPKLKVQKVKDSKEESVTLPNGQKIEITRDANGKIKTVTIQANKDGSTVDYSKDEAIGYARLGKIPPALYDWNKVLELAIRIFGETPTED